MPFQIRSPSHSNTSPRTRLGAFFFVSFLVGSHICGLDLSKYPPPDKVPPTDSPFVKEWLAKIDLSKVPAIPIKGIGGCENATNAAAITKAGPDGDCWWTCGGCTSKEDVTTCPVKNTWGLSYDDGPTENSVRLLDYLDQHQLKATFFVVGSRILDHPDILKREYSSGHDMKYHTWSHTSLTTLTNEQIVAEFAWSIKIIHDVLGITLTDVRPPYGDVDNRVRAVAKAMGLRIIIWTSAKPNESFDTDDWRVITGERTPETAFQKFEAILADAATLSTGFIVLAHDLYPQTVALAVERILPSALADKKLKLQSISTCLGESSTGGTPAAPGSKNGTSAALPNNTNTTNNIPSANSSLSKPGGSQSTSTNPTSPVNTSSSQRGTQASTSAAPQMIYPSRSIVIVALCLLGVRLTIA
ncbi:hypothetical protein O181_012775 [Austropuccinia psidii MF-1]|uniref:chitin deacetylase n=1 Tax=Austropuccinia psidii MF-1 TaxID=1389203 RepID=A0A9Q3BXR0_9BASI|nr:hypothetical protein [Austropuccinia psidii MF-1]